MNWGTKMRTTVLLCLIPGLATQAAERILDRDTAEVCMDIAVSARLRGLEDFELKTADADGSDGALYTGSDYFELETNAPVRLMISGRDLSNRNDQLQTTYSIDGSSAGIETGAGAHQDIHQLSAITELGDISDQLAGTYSASVRITVVPMVSSVRTCEMRPVIRPRQSETQEVETELVIPLTKSQDTDSSELDEVKRIRQELDALNPADRIKVEKLLEKVVSNASSKAFGAQ